MGNGWSFQATVSRFPGRGISSRAFEVENNPGEARRRLGSKEAPAVAVRFESNFLRVSKLELFIMATS
jgi:hypothetical protein